MIMSCYTPKSSEAELGKVYPSQAVIVQLYVHTEADPDSIDFLIL